jgi:hypothetical protein
MYTNRPGRNVCRILPAGLFLVLAANSLLADSFTITGTADMSTIPGISVGEQWTGTLTTDGTCSVCTPNTPTFNGGLLTLSIDMYGNVFTALDAEGYPASPIFDRASGNLTLAVSAGGDIISIGEPSGTFDLSDEDVGASGTFSISAGSSTPEPAGIVLLSTVLVITFVTLRKKKAIRS